jgi:hypothetical protein
MEISFQKKFDEIFRGNRSSWLKTGAGALIALYVTALSIFRVVKPAERSTAWRTMLVCVLCAAVCGALIAFLLTVKDRVKRRLAKGDRVNLFVRAYLGSGIWSLLLWCPTIFFFGIATICSIAVIQNMLKH